MKAAAYTLAIAALVASPVQAEVFATAANASGGEIVLTTLKGKCQNDQLMAFARTKEGATVHGCWSYMKPYVIVNYQDNDQRIYQATIFRLANPPANDAPAAKGRAL